MSSLRLSLILGLMFWTNELSEINSRAGVERAIETPAVKDVDTLVICPQMFQPALADWLDYRHQQGHSIQIVTPARTVAEIKMQIRRLALISKLKFVFLIGDTGQRDAHEKQADSNLIPVNYVAAQVNQLFGSEPEIATDNPYADLDDDGLPDLALGRLTADSPDEVREYLDRVMHYENLGVDEQAWRRNVNFVAGVGGFGGIIDNVLEQTAKQIIAELIPQHYQTSMTFGNWRSPFCPDPRQFSQTAIQRFNEGCLFWVYIGHGLPTRLDRVRLPDQSHAILDNRSSRHLHSAAGNPIAIFLSCYTGKFDHPQDCLAETMMRQPGGPIAAICSTRVTMPYALSLLSLEIVNGYFVGDVATIGELIQRAKVQIVSQHDRLQHDGDPSANPSPPTNQYREMILQVGKLISPRPELLRAECLEHAHLMQLLGDPLLRLPRPKKIELTNVDVAESGDEFTVSGLAPFAGELSLELVYRRDRFRRRPPHRGKYRPTDKEFRNYQHVYESANDLTCDTQRNVVQPGRFEIAIRVPADASGPCAVRCMLSSPQGFGLGSSTVEIQKSQTDN